MAGTSAAGGAGGAAAASGVEGSALTPEVHRAHALTPGGTLGAAATMAGMREQGGADAEQAGGQAPAGAARPERRRQPPQHHGKLYGC